MAAVTEQRVEIFSPSPFFVKKVADSPPPSPADDKADFRYDTRTTPVAPTVNVSVPEEVVLAMGIPKAIVELVKAAQHLEHGTSIATAGEFYAAAEELLGCPEEQARLAKKLFESEQAKKEKEVQNTDLVEKKVKAAPTESKPSEGKADLKEKVKHLAEENHRLKQRKMCRACRKVDLASSGITFLPCGHFITCETCSEKFDDCPACGKSIMGTVRTFLS